jgi:pseudouridylate synthase / pseudouridine kinase
MVSISLGTWRHGSYNHGLLTSLLGGVARNVAEAAHRILASPLYNLPSATALVCGVGPDAFGRLLTDETKMLQMRTDAYLVNRTSRSAVCNMVLDGHGALVSGVADMDIAEQLSGEQVLQQLRRLMPPVVALDGNLSPETLEAAIRHCQEENIICMFLTLVSLYRFLTYSTCSVFVSSMYFSEPRVV